MELAKKITVYPKTHRLHFNGVEFPYYISADGVDVPNVGAPASIPRVSFTVLAEVVEVVDEDGAL